MKPPSKKIGRTKWTNEDELELLKIWESHQNELRQAKRNAHIYARMSKEMGGKFTPNEVHIKIANLAQRYRTERKDWGPSGGSSSNWTHFNSVHKIIGSNAANNASVESFPFFATNTNSNELLTPLLVSPSSPLPPSSRFSPSLPVFKPEIEPSSLQSSVSFDQGIMHGINELKKQTLKPSSKQIRRKKWTNDDELELLQIWESHQSELRQAKRNAHIYARMSKAMGGKFTPNEVHIKIANLTQRYRSEKKGVGPSGGISSKWAHFNSVHKIIGSNAANNASVESFQFLATNTNSNELLTPLLVSPSSPLPPSSRLSPSLPVFKPEIEPSSLQSSVSFDQGVMNSMNELKKQTFKPSSKKIRRKKWTIDDELELLQIWESHQSELRQAKRNAHIYARMSKEMGGKFTPNEVHIKIANLTQRYRSERKDVGPSGGSSSKWAHFNSVHKIIGSDAANNNASVESFAFFATNTKSNELPLLISASSQLPPSSRLSPSQPVFQPELESSSSASSVSFDQEIMNSMNELKKQGEEQLKIFKNVATAAQDLSENLANYMQSQQENEKYFLAYFTKFMEKKTVVNKPLKKRCRQFL